MLCTLIDVYPKMMSPRAISRTTGIPVSSVRSTIVKMTNRYLLSEEIVNHEVCYFFADDGDKRKTIAMVQERIRTAHGNSKQ